MAFENNSFEKDLQIIFAHEDDARIEYIEKHDSKEALLEAVAKDIINGEEADEEFLEYLLSQPLKEELRKDIFEIRKKKSEENNHSYLKTMIPFLAGMALIAWWLFTHEL